MERYRRIRLYTGRAIDLPSEEQRLLLTRCFQATVRHLPAHPAAHGYVHGRSVETALTPHLGCTYLCHLDLRKFFHSCKSDAIYQRLILLGFSVREAWDICYLCCNTWGLPVGAPTSPALSNLAAWTLDEELSHWTTYTRYSDQLILSGPLPPSEGGLRSVVRRCGFRVNESKSFLRKRGTGKMVLMGYSIGESELTRSRESRRRERARLHQLGLAIDQHLDREG